jgi:hypothetical protein
MAESIRHALVAARERRPSAVRSHVYVALLNEHVSTRCLRRIDHTLRHRLERKGLSL